MKNIANPAVSEGAGVSDAMRVARGSNQTPETCQLSGNANRMVTRKPAGPSGKAEIDPSGIMEEQGRISDTHSTGYNYRGRKKLFS